MIASISDLTKDKPNWLLSDQIYMGKTVTLLRFPSPLPSVLSTLIMRSCVLPYRALDYRLWLSLGPCIRWCRKTNKLAHSIRLEHISISLASGFRLEFNNWFDKRRKTKRNEKQNKTPRKLCALFCFVLFRIIMMRLGRLTT